MKLIESATQNQGKTVVFTFDTNHQLWVYSDKTSWITNKNHSKRAVAVRFPNLYKKMLIAITKGI